MKILLIFIFQICFAAYSQTAHIKELRFRPSSQFYKTKNFTIIFPRVIIGNPSVEKIINQQIEDEIFSTSTERLGFNKDLLYEIKYGLIEMSYKLTFNKDYILSLNISTQKNIDNHLYDLVSYFNFDLKTGKNLTISDLFDENKIDTFKTKVAEDKNHFLRAYENNKIREYLNKNEIDSITYEFIVSDIENNCYDHIDFETFCLTKNGIEILDPCRFSHALRAMEAEYILQYSYAYLYPLLKPKIRKQLK